jgi:hypothetical protein
MQLGARTMQLGARTPSPAPPRMGALAPSLPLDGRLYITTSRGRCQEAGDKTSALFFYGSQAGVGRVY